MKYIFALVVLRFIDLFGGIGGFRLGLEKANQRFRCVWYCDNNKYAVQVYNKNFKEKYMPTDIREVETRSIPDFDLLCAGFPCQSFSVAGKRKGFDDTRGTLFFEIARILRDKRPGHLLLENVKGLLSHDSGKTFQTILGVLSDIGYRVQWRVLNSKDFGVPQNRERVFIIGHLGGKCRPEILFIRQNDEIYSGEKTSQGSYLKSPLRGQGDKPMIVHNIYGGFNEKKPRMFKDYSPTIRTPKGGGHLPAVLEIGEIPAVRRLTPIECERLQGFPDNWTRYGTDENNEMIEISDTQRYKMAGNAVSVNVIKAIGESVSGDR